MSKKLLSLTTLIFLQNYALAATDVRSQCKAAVSACLSPIVCAQGYKESTRCYRYDCDVTLTAGSDSGGGLFEKGEEITTSFYSKDMLFSLSNDSIAILSCNDDDSAKEVLVQLKQPAQPGQGTTSSAANRPNGPSNSPRNVSQTLDIWGCPQILVKTDQPGYIEYNNKYPWTNVEITYSWNASRAGNKYSGNRTERFSALIGPQLEAIVSIPVGAASGADLFDCKTDNWGVQIIRWRDGVTQATSF
jgi:hypothetical protein